MATALSCKILKCRPETQCALSSYDTSLAGEMQRKGCFLWTGVFKGLSQALRFRPVLLSESGGKAGCRLCGLGVARSQS